MNAESDIRRIAAHIYELRQPCTGYHTDPDTARSHHGCEFATLNTRLRSDYPILYLYIILLDTVLFAN
jgi:hypothetical protein